MQASNFDLHKILSPVTEAEFLGQYWRRRPLILQRSDPGFYDPLFPAREVDTFLNTAACNASDFMVTIGPNLVPKTRFTGRGSSVHLNALLGLYDEGAVVRVNNAHNYHPPLATLCKGLQGRFQAYCESDLWITPREYPDFFHFDTHDIFILAVSGRKRWRIFSPDPVGFVRAHAGIPLDRARFGEPIFDTVIEPGDLIYLPAGTPHLVNPVTSHGIHVGLGVHPITWIDVLEGSVRALKQTAASIHSPVPMAFLGVGNEEALQDGLLSTLEISLRGQDLRSLQVAILEDLLGDNLDDGHIYTQVLADPPVTLSTAVEQRMGPLERSYAGIRANRAFIAFASGGFVDGPEFLADDLKFIAEQSQPFTVKSLPGALNEEERLTLVRKLIRNGFLRQVAA